ncbi:MAG: hypothetical protein IJI84_03750 [Clostridia bacterium]|nr:hypothetical protein [Clostridia bacterium]
MKFKRTITSILAATFSLTLMGSSAPRTFAKGETPEITTEQKLDSKTQEELNQEVKKLDEQGKLDELKEKIKKIENEITDLKKETGWSFKKGINAIKNSVTSFVMFFVGTTVLSIWSDTLLDPELLKGEKDISEVLLNNIKSNKYTYFFKAFFSTSTAALYRFTYA